MKKYISLIGALILTSVLLASCMEGSDGADKESSADSADTAVQTEPVVTEAPAPVELARISFLAAGDNVIHSAVIEDALQEDGSYDFAPMFGGVADMISSADVAFVSQETVMAGDDMIQGYPKYNSPRALGDTLVGLGFDIVSTASNHMLDMEPAGMIKTAEWWASAHPEVLLTGFYRDEEDFNTVRVYTEQKSGIRIAMLTYTYYNYVPVADDCGVWVPFISEKDITKQVTAAKELADVIIVSMHWGGETENVQNETQEKLASLLCDLGVDVVIGTHPFYVQPMVTLTNSEGHSTVVAYSLGNFLSGMLSPRALLGGMLTFDIVKTDRGTYIENPAVTPTYCHYYEDGREFRLFRLSDYTQKLAEVHGAQETEPFSLYDLNRIFDRTMFGDREDEEAGVTVSEAAPAEADTEKTAEAGE